MKQGQFSIVFIVGSHIGGQLSLSGSKVRTLILEDDQVYSTVFLARNAEFDGVANVIFNKVGENLELGDGDFQGNVDITGTQIGGELRLGSSHLKSARWRPNTTLILRNTSATAIQDLPDAWPDKLDLIGFTYHSLGGLYAAEKDPMVLRSVKWFKRWLRKQEPYAPGPYQQLASVLREQGKPDTADDVLYDGKEREQAQSTLSGRRRRPLKGSPPSAAQTERAVFPHSAFMNGCARSGEKESVRQG